MTEKHTKKVQRLIAEAKTRLKASNDLLHDAGHANRVASYASGIARSMGIEDPQYIEALEISAWWHDVSRTITKKPSFVLMPFVDDTLSAIMLVITIFKRRAFTRSSFLACRLVLSKSIATGKIFSRVFLTKKMRTLLDILTDADTVDTLAAERTEVIRGMVGSSKFHAHTYRAMIWWFATPKFFEMKTHAAKAYLLQVLEEFLEWIHEEHVRLWHIERYGMKWLEGMLNRLGDIMHNLELQLSATHST